MTLSTWNPTEGKYLETGHNEKRQLSDGDLKLVYALYYTSYTPVEIELMAGWGGESKLANAFDSDNMRVTWNLTSIDNVNDKSGNQISNQECSLYFQECAWGSHFLEKLDSLLCNGFTFITL